METLLTARLALVQTPLGVLQTRLVRETFVADVSIAGEEISATFPAEWPGHAIVLFPMMIEAMKTGPEAVPWGGTVIERGANVAVGQIGCKNLPGSDGAIEIGYGMNASCHNRGFATEIVSTFVSWLLTRPEVTRIVAECCTDNVGSIRVLEKSGFIRIGHRDDDDDGPLIIWERQRT